MPRALTLLLAGFIGGVLAVVGLVALNQQLSVSLQSAVTAEQEPAQPQVYGRR
ncbi:hypothetical protein AB0H83_43665 [Dactylosporangium sp. NPDC050688]|uniref:hypothetical protein n=1 Tax=Dactylosporangium sp. NPDC050688 TaxID=3157217 RepID=UPI00340036F3